MIKKIVTTTVFCLNLAILSHGQKIVDYTGYGRALVSTEQYNKNSNFISHDTVSRKKSLNGNFVFDLGVNIKPDETFRANAILRVTNQFGGFFSVGSALQFRQVQIQGIAAKKIAYQIGDIDLMSTKYTLFNNYESLYTGFEADAFKIRRDIVSYDNFNTGNSWRLQGVQANTTLVFDKVIKAIDFNVYGTRIKPSDFLKTPDRLLTGGNIKIRQGKFLELGGNVVYISDVPGTVKDTVVFYQNTVVTGDYKLYYSNEKMEMSLFGETGFSNYNLNKIEDSMKVKKNDVFFDMGAGIKHKKSALNASVSYRVVGPDFSSPGAQTMRVNNLATPELLGDGLNGAKRYQTAFDRASDLNLYNRSISTTLMNYLPMYNNATPYGVATPNRKGTSVDIMYGNKDSLLYANVHSEFLSEVIGTGMAEKRKYMVVNAGFTFNVNKLIGLNRLLALSSGIRYENTNGPANADIKLTSTLIDAGIAVETVKGLDLLGGMKSFSAKGNEYASVVNEFNTINSYVQYKSNNMQNVYTVGTRYRFSNYIFFAVNGLFTSNNDQVNNNYNYKFNQWFFSYVMKF